MKADSNDLMFSIVVPVYEHWHLVPQLLTCLRQQTLPQHRFEVIVVDNGSGDISIPHELADNVDILYCTTPGSYAARNEGVKRAKGTWLIFTDADCLPHPGWLASYSHYIDKLGNHFCLLTGPIEMVLNTTEPNVYQIYDSVKGIPQYRYYKRGYAATANLAVNRQVMEAVGGFDSQRFSGGDAAFCEAAARHGALLNWVAEAVIGHPARKSWNEVASKAKRIKGGQVASGKLAKRLYWLFRSLVPPFIEIYNLMNNKRYSLKMRLTACVVQLKVWCVSIAAIVDFLRYKKIER